MIKFVLIANQRSGTAFFRSVLNGHPDIFVDSELFLNDLYAHEGCFYNYWLRQIQSDPANIAIPVSVQQLNFLEWFYQSHPDKKAVGLDLKYNQHEVHLPKTMEVLFELRVKVIHLVRINLLKTYISSRLNQRQKELGRRSHGTKKVAPVKVNLGPEILPELERREGQINRWREILNNNFSCLEIHYEDFFNSNDGESDTLPGHVLSKVFDFLEIDNQGNAGLITQLRKTNPNDLQDLIANYEEVRRGMANTKWAYLLE